MPLKDKLAFMASLGYSQMAPAKILKSLKGIGYSGVEWPLSFFSPREKSTDERKRLVEMTNNYGMEVTEVVVQQDVVSLDESVRRDRTELVVECIDAAAECGVGTLSLFTGPAPWSPDSPKIPNDISEGAASGMVFEAYEKFVARAEEKGVDLAVEGVWGMLCRDFYTTRLLIDQFDTPRLGVNLDPSHDVLVGNFDSGWIAKRRYSVNACRRPLQRSIFSRIRDRRRLETSPTSAGASICIPTMRSLNTHRETVGR